MKKVLSTCQPGIRVIRQYVGGKVEGWNRFMWDKAFFLFFISKLLFPNYNNPAFTLCVGTGKKQKQKNENKN